MIQQFWALPFLAIAGIGMRLVTGFTVITFFVSRGAFGASLQLVQPGGNILPGGYAFFMRGP